MVHKFSQHRFLFEELVKRDFSLKYKRTFLGVLWSILSPLCMLLITWIVLSKFFGSNIDHYVVYLFSGQIIFSCFTDATNLGMTSLVENSGIYTKVNVPKYLFLLSKNISTIVNFLLTFILLMLVVAIERIPFTWKFLTLLFPIACLMGFNIGVGLILSALFMFFRDMQYLWGVFTQLLGWVSATFYRIDAYSYEVQQLFLLNPIYLYIRYFRKIILEGTIPTLQFHLLALSDTVVVLVIGLYMYKKYNHEFLYYV